MEEFQDQTLKEDLLGVPEREEKRSRDPPSAGVADLRSDEKAIAEIVLSHLFSFLTFREKP